MEFKDYYATLGLSKSATDAEIKRAYRKLARQFHPDVNPGDTKAESRFKDINEANEVLGDPEKRRKYDELGAHWRDYDQAERAGQDPSQGWSQPFAGAGAGGGTYRTMTPEEMQEAFGGETPFSDFFQTFFGGAGFAGAGGATSARAGRSARASRGRDVEHPIDLTLEEAYAGTTRRLVSTRNGQERTVDVRIPAGVKDGARVRAAGEGGPASKGGAAGDLYLTVRVLPHPRFERKGQDLHTRVDVPVTTAVLGGQVSVPLLSGTSVRLKVPPLTSSGRVFRLRAHGLPSVGRSEERGDLYATVAVKIPAQLSDEERAHWEALRDLTETVSPS